MRNKHWLYFSRIYKSLFIFALFLQSISVDGVYINRFSTTDNGGILFTGNAQGLSKQASQNQPGTQDSSGAFITTDQTSQVGSYLPGTTLSWQLNSSNAFLDLPTGSTVLYAELIWAGSYGFNGEVAGNEINTPVTLITPQNTSFSVTPDPTTSQVAITPGYTNAGNYVRSANVTALIQAGGAGKYTVGGIPGTISRLDDTHNAGGWTLAVAYQNPSMLTYNMTIFVGCEQSSSTLKAPALVAGFCVPPSGYKQGTLSISAIEGDANKTGDHMLFGSTPTLTAANNSLSGPNNPINNFFASQINTLVSFSDTLIPGKLVVSSTGGLDRRGSFGGYNHNAQTGAMTIAGRQGYDITSIDVSNTLAYNQTTAYALGTTTSDDYTINALGMQILVGSPIISALKAVNGETQIYTNIGDTVLFTFTFVNDGTSPGTNPIFRDVLQSGLTYIPNTFTYNGVLQPDPDLTVGFGMSDLLISGSATISFNALVSLPLAGSVIQNTATVDYNFVPCTGTGISLSANTNMVELILPNVAIPQIQIPKIGNSGQPLTPDQPVAVQTVIARVGDTVTYSFVLTNAGQGDALNVVVIDPLPTGLTLVPNSALVNGIVVTPDPDLAVGIPVGNLLAGASVAVEFQARINGFPTDGNSYPNSATVVYQYQNSNGDLDDLTDGSNTVDVDVIVDPSFVGTLKKCKTLNKTLYCLNASWSFDSPNILYYKLYHNNQLIKVIYPGSPLVYQQCFSSRRDAQGFEIAAVYPPGDESARVPLRIIL